MNHILWRIYQGIRLILAFLQILMCIQNQYILTWYAAYEQDLATIVDLRLDVFLVHPKSF